MIDVVTIFNDRIRFETIEPHTFTEMLKPEGLTYDEFVQYAKDLIALGFLEITSEYFELNEFEDPITCLYVSAG